MYHHLHCASFYLTLSYPFISLVGNSVIYSPYKIFLSKSIPLHAILYPFIIPSTDYFLWWHELHKCPRLYYQTETSLTEQHILYISCLSLHFNYGQICTQEFDKYHFGKWGFFIPPSIPQILLTDFRWMHEYFSQNICEKKTTL